MARVFFKHVGPGDLSFDPSTGRIHFSTRIYEAEKLAHRMIEIDISESEWQAIVQYGIDAGYEDPRP